MRNYFKNKLKKAYDAVEALKTKKANLPEYEEWLETRDAKLRG